MYALVLAVGGVVDRLGRRPTLVGGLVLMAVACASLLTVRSVPATAPKEPTPQRLAAIREQLQLLADYL